MASAFFPFYRRTVQEAAANTVQYPDEKRDIRKTSEGTCDELALPLAHARWAMLPEAIPQI